LSYTNQVRDWVFRRIHHNNLVYNTCWEDPRCDRELLQLNRTSKVVMITSAGCNALDYLLDDPQQIHCVDVNPRQNALLELKRASIRQLDFNRHFALFGLGRDSQASRIYREELRPVLPPYAQRIWDRHISHFNGRGVRKSFYQYGTSGFLAWLLIGYFRARPSTWEQLQALFAAEDLATQRARYEALEPRLITQLVHWLVNQHLTMCLIGVPNSQRALFQEKYERGVTGFLQASLRRIFLHQPIKDNYFWQLYFRGRYSADCCPNYLKAAAFPDLRQREQRISQYTTDLTSFLQTHPDKYTHYVLLDHQDWLAEHNRPALQAEWEAILRNSQQGTRILLRSAAETIDFFPPFVHDRVAFIPQAELAAVHARDRVGTYASVYLGIVQ
jgi:S-adenosylmethionine-diacylglycerol 3-amino-3-carboxypropyl transferase